MNLEHVAHINLKSNLVVRKKLAKHFFHQHANELKNLINCILVNHHQAYNYFQNQKNNDQNYISIFQTGKICSTNSSWNQII
jgi:alpha/beta superfamily hydrolase